MNTRFIQNAMKHPVLGINTAILIMMYECLVDHSDFNEYSALVKNILFLGLIGLCARYISESSKKNIQHRNFKQDYSESTLDYKPISYHSFQDILSNVTLPAAMIDLDAFNHNVATLKNIVQPSGKTLRIATKSIRSPDLIRRALASGAPYKGVMCYNVEEANMLYNEHGIDDILIGYPTLQFSELKTLRRMHDAGAKMSLVVDSVEHLKRLSKEMEGVTIPFPVVVEMDVSIRFLNGFIHLGARRSPIQTLHDLEIFLTASKAYPNIKIMGVMAYEAIVAGLPDNNPFKKLLNPFVYYLRKYAAHEIAKTRSEIPRIFAAFQLKLEIFNGAGTGSIDYAIKEEALTEVTAGNALTCPPVVDYYSNLQAISFLPAGYFATPVCRSSNSYITCKGGGFIGSGELGSDKLPVPVSPKGLSYTSSEGAGEVQTPLHTSDKIIPDFVVFRPAKFGELAERIPDICLFQSKKDEKEKKETVAVIKTYRGMNHAFH